MAKGKGKSKHTGKPSRKPQPSTSSQPGAGTAAKISPSKSTAVASGGGK